MIGKQAFESKLGSLRYHHNVTGGMEEIRIAREEEKPYHRKDESITMVSSLREAGSPDWLGGG